MRRSHAIVTALAPIIGAVGVVTAPFLSGTDLLVIGLLITGIAGPSDTDYVTAVLVALRGVPDTGVSLCKILT